LRKAPCCLLDAFLKRRIAGAQRQIFQKHRTSSRIKPRAGGRPASGRLLCLQFRPSYPARQFEESYMNEPVSPILSELVAEVLANPIPYRLRPEIKGQEGFYLVCDYKPIPKGTVLVYFRPRDLAILIYGYLPQATAEERAALNALLSRHITAGGSLDTEAIEQSLLRVCSEEEAVQRLLEVQQLIGVQRASTSRPILH
jgi:hypothetical protein